ncbi:MAG: hypothetical protein OEV31_02225, partial [Gammaproteobacteria bacterium]|nr:hypothetical protein [Gammaproteobacteria bacterium]
MTFRMRLRRGGVVRFVSSLFLAVGLLAAAPVFAAGLDYLATQQQADGSFGGTPTTLATPVQTTAEVLRAYQALGLQPTAYTAALNFLSANTETNTEYLSRKIIVSMKAGVDATALINT